MKQTSTIALELLIFVAFADRRTLRDQERNRPLRKLAARKREADRRFRKHHWLTSEQKARKFELQRNRREAARSGRRHCANNNCNSFGYICLGKSGESACRDVR